VFFEALAPFLEALGEMLEDRIWDGRIGAGIGLGEVIYHRKMRAIILNCANAGSVQPVKDLVLTLRVDGKSYRAWGEAEEPVSFDMVAFLSPWQKTPKECILRMLAHNNPGIPVDGTEVVQIWEQGKSRKIDLKSDQAFYDFVRSREWRLNYTLGYADCLVGRHGELAPRQDHQVTVGVRKEPGEGGRFGTNCGGNKCDGEKQGN
jgi:hypothetical protein